MTPCLLSNIRFCKSIKSKIVAQGQGMDVLSRNTWVGPRSFTLVFILLRGHFDQIHEHILITS